MTKEQGEQLAREHKMEFFQTSAKTGENVDTMFDEIAQKVISLQQIRMERDQSNAKGGGNTAEGGAGGAANKQKLARQGSQRN